MDLGHGDPGRQLPHDVIPAPRDRRPGSLLRHVFGTVLRDRPQLPANAFFERPTCQFTKISQISITPNVLLATGPRPSTEA